MKVKLKRHRSGCLVCGGEIVYTQAELRRDCEYCGTSYESNAACENGHFVCDDCHAAGAAGFSELLPRSRERDATALFLQIARLDGVSLHGPEHHQIVPCVLLTAYRNCGGTLDLEAALRTAVSRGLQVPGGTCGYHGACGAAVGAGIFASVALGSNPLNAEVWSLPQSLTAECLARIAELGGPRCCKRTARIAIECAARFSGERLGVAIEVGSPVCEYSRQNRQCIGGACPYFGGERDAV